MQQIVWVCIALVGSVFGGCTVSIKIEFVEPKVQPPPQREATAKDIERWNQSFRWLEGMGEKIPAPPKKFYNPATAEDYNEAHRYLEKNPEKPAVKPPAKELEFWEPNLYGPS
jgi:hypothetical protein